MALSPEERQIVEYGAQQGKTREEILSALARFRANQVQREPGGAFSRAVKDIPQDIAQTWREFVSSLRQAGQGIVQEATSDKPLLERVVGAGADFFKGLSGAVGSVFTGAARLPFTQQAENRAAEIAQNAVALALKTRPAQALIDAYLELPDDSKANVNHALSYAEGALTLLGGRAGAGIVGSELSKATTAAQKGAQAVRAAAQTVGETGRKTGTFVGNITRPVREYVKRLAETPDATDVATIDDAIEGLASVLDDSVQKSQSLTRALNRVARLQSTQEVQVERKDLLKALIAEGVVPQLDGDRLALSNAIQMIGAKRNQILEREIQPILQKLDASGVKVPMKRIQEKALQLAKLQAPGAELPKIERAVQAIAQAYTKKYGSSLNASQLNEVRTELNKLTKAYKNNEFVKADASDILAKAVRGELYSLDQRLPASIAKVERTMMAERIASALDGAKVPVDEYVGAIGRYIATVGAGALGGSFVAGGPGSLVIAGLVATLGERAVANLMRQKRIPPDLLKQIQQELQQNPELMERLIKAGLPKTLRAR